MKSVSIPISIVASLLISFSAFAEPFAYSVPVTISNPQNDLTEFQVKIAIDTRTLIEQGKLNGNCSDLRVLGQDGVSDIPFWIEQGCNSYDTQIWVRVPLLAANTDTIIYVSYGEPGAKGIGDPDAVFEFYDGFSGNALDTAKWAETLNQDYVYSVKTGYLNVDTSGIAGRTLVFESNYTFSEPVIIEHRTYVSNTYGITGQIGNLLHWFTGELLIAYSITSNNISQGVSYPRGQIFDSSEIYDAANNLARGCYGVSCTAFYPVTSLNSPLSIRVFDHSNMSDTKDLYKVDWLRVRKFADLDVSLQYGQEEDSSVFANSVGECSGAILSELTANIGTEIASIDTSVLSGRDSRRLEEANRLFLSARAYIAVGDLQRAISEIDRAVEEISRMRSDDAEFLYELVARMLLSPVETSISNLLSLEPSLDLSSAQNRLDSGKQDLENGQYLQAIDDFKRAYDRAYAVARNEF